MNGELAFSHAKMPGVVDPRDVHCVTFIYKENKRTQLIEMREFRTLRHMSWHKHWREQQTASRLYLA
jgi:hypothetical protein